MFKPFVNILTALLTSVLFLCASTSTHADNYDLAQSASEIRRCWHICSDIAAANGEQALQYVQLAGELTQNEIDAFVLVAGYLPRVYIDRGEFDKAEQITRLYLDRRLNPTNPIDHARVISNQGIIFKTTGRYILAKQAYLNALEIYESLERAGAMGNIYNNLALVSMSENNLDDAIEYLFKALPLIESGSTPAPYATALANVGVAYMKMSEYALADEYVTRALSVIETTDHLRKHAEILLYKSELALDMGKVAQARSFADQTLKLAQNADAKDTVALAYHQLALVEQEVDNAEQAYQFIEQGLFIAERAQSSSLYNSLLKSKIHLLLQMQQIDQAKALIAPALAVALAENQNAIATSLQQLQLKTARLENDYETAFQIQTALFDQYRKSSTNERENKLAQYSVLLDQQEKLRQIAELNQRDTDNQIALLHINQSKRNVIFIAAALSVVFIIAVFVLWHRRRIAVLEARSAATLVAQKDQMLSDVSHELKTPLAAIKLQVELIEHDLSDDPQQAFETVHNKIANLNRLINDVFQLALADVGELDIYLEPVEMTSFIRDCFSSFEPMVKEAGHIYGYHIAFDAERFVNCDRIRLEQVFNNLISNSCRYTDLPGEIQVTAYIEHHQLVVDIEDSTPGIPQKYRPKVFDRLYRLDKSRSREFGGSGLGLSLCKALIKAHGGKIWLDDSMLGGLRVTIRLPLCNKETDD